MMNNKILLGHGSGGKLSHQLINDVFLKHFGNKILNHQNDAAVLTIKSKNIAFTTDSYVVDPFFFPGGNIGSLAISGTVNDLAVSGATPCYLSASFIIEEGLPLEELEQVVETMAKEAKEAGVIIVTGDTKVVNRGKCDKLFINTTGVGVFSSDKGSVNREIGFGSLVKAGDRIIINGFIADHGMAVMGARENLQFEEALISDVAPLNKMIAEVQDAGIEIKFMRDATRGGLATVLVELANKIKMGVEVHEEKIPVRESVKGLCEILGFDPLYVANEGKVVIVVSAGDEEQVLNILKGNKYGCFAASIGEITGEHKGMALLNTEIGGKRVLDMLAGEQLPRIC